MDNTLASFTDVLDEEICDSQPISLPSSNESNAITLATNIATAEKVNNTRRPTKGTGQRGHFRSTDEIDPKYRGVFTYPYFNLVQSRVIEDALYSDKSVVVCAPTGSGKTVIFEMAIVQLLMELEDKHYTDDFKIIYMAPVKALCTERLTEWYPKFTKLGLMCIEVTGDTDVDFTQLKPYKIIITTPEKWDMLTRRWRDHSNLVEVIKLFLIDEVHILNDESRGPVLEAVVSRMKTIESSAQSVHRIELLQNQLHGSEMTHKTAPSIRFIAVSATVSNPEDVATWLGTSSKPAVFHKFGDECRPVKLKRIVEGYPCPEGSSIFKFDIVLNYKLWPVIQKYHSGKPTLIFCNTRKSVILTAETLSRELTINFNAEQKAKLTALASTIKNKKLQSLVMSGVGCHHAGLLYEERQNIELAFRNRDLPILITTTTLAMGVNLPAHLVIIKNTQQYVNGAYQEYSISTVLQMVGRAGRPQFDTEATAVIMTRLADKARYQALVGGCEPLQSYLHKRLPENLNSEAALRTVGDVAQCVQWLRSTFLYVRAARDPKKYLNLPINSPPHLISKKIEELCVKAMNGLATAGLITMDEASCIESTEAGRLMSIFYLDLETMKQLMKIEGTESLERLLVVICESHELADMHLRVDERRCLNTLNRNNTAATIRFPMKGKISTRQMKLNCIIQAVLGCLAIPDPSLNQEAMKIMRIADRVCKCLVSFVTRPDLISRQPQFYSAVLNSIILAKCITAHLWENSPYVSKQLKGIGPTFSTLLATAGKVNFMLLEESHPRDLERIMNKGAPAGNVLRKQISLLPKYQLTMLPIDENTVTVQLVLINQAFLSENIEQLTAGATHKSYIIVGDSNNHVLLLASFKDKDLISVFDGTITHEIRRRHSHEHKIFAHCVSSTFVGIDVQAEYIFNDLNQFFGAPNTNYKNEVPVKETVTKQTCITDTFKARKRKSTADLDKTQSKEKKKRDNAIIENFKYLKQTFETASKNVKDNVNLSVDAHNVPNYKTDTIPEKETVSRDKNNEELSNIEIINLTEDFDDNDFIDDEKIDSILTEIESEMSRKKENSINSNFKSQQIDKSRSLLSKFQRKPAPNFSSRTILERNNEPRKRKPANVKSNYNFIELIERNLDVSDEDDKPVTTKENNGFSETIKNQINKYLRRAETHTKTSDANVELLLDNKNKDLKGKVVTDSDGEEDLPATQKLYPRYEIKEILDGQNTKVNNSKGFRTKDLGTSDCISYETAENSSPKIFNTNNHLTIERSKDTPQDDVNPNINLDRLSVSENPVIQHKIHENIDDSVQKSTTFATNLCDSIERPSSSCNISKNPLNSGDGTSRKKTIDIQNVLGPSKDNTLNTNELEIKQHIRTQGDDLDLIPLRDFEGHTPGNKENADTNYKNYSLVPFSSKDSTETDKMNVKTLEKVAAEEDFKTDHLNINQLSENKLVLATHINPNLVSQNVARTGMSNNDPCIDMDNSSQFCSNNSKEQNRNTTEYIKNYSFSTTKFGVCTKETPEYSVRVIKKIKMDLDITEIVSSTKPRQSDIPNFNLNSKSFDAEEVSCNETNNDNTSYNYYRHLGPLNALEYAEKTFSSDLVEDENKNSCQVLVDQRPQAGHESIATATYEENAKENFEDSLKVLEITDDNNDTKYKPNTNLANNSTIECKTSQNHNNVSCNQPNNEIEIEEVERGKTVERTECNKVQNILQKYSRILGKEPAKPPVFTPQHHSSTNRDHTYQQFPEQKFKKPFKISDIQKLKATLPDTIIDCNKKNSEEYLPASITATNEEAMNEIHVPSDHCLPCYNTDPVDLDVSSLVEENIEPIEIPDIDFEPAAEFKIDQSMFDPRTLLQCTVDSECEEIIPPPPQFCDNDPPIPNSLNFIYKDGNVYNNISQYEDKPYDCSSILQDDDLNYNQNIFEDQCIKNLTPSREIETWTLEEDDACEDIYSTWYVVQET
ncbi:uncharacterized protein LOC142977749 [Anticarsia gemmatalis]|uniref:uncharacterized protein LOC142977749 n=1 Tax=Anticarsia gemmatalis TaxID=129554 RepID=UPI003F7617AD